MCHYCKEQRRDFFKEEMNLYACENDVDIILVIVTDKLHRYKWTDVDELRNAGEYKRNSACVDKAIITKLDVVIDMSQS